WFGRRRQKRGRKPRDARCLSKTRYQRNHCHAPYFERLVPERSNEYFERFRKREPRSGKRTEPRKKRRRGTHAGRRFRNIARKKRTASPQRQIRPGGNVLFSKTGQFFRIDLQNRTPRICAGTGPSGTL